MKAQKGTSVQHLQHHASWNCFKLNLCADHLWWSGAPGRASHPNKDAPRCLPCNYPDHHMDASKAPFRQASFHCLPSNSAHVSMPLVPSPQTTTQTLPEPSSGEFPLLILLAICLYSMAVAARAASREYNRLPAALDHPILHHLDSRLTPLTMVSTQHNNSKPTTMCVGAGHRRAVRARPSCCATQTSGAPPTLAPAFNCEVSV